MSKDVPHSALPSNIQRSSAEEVLIPIRPLKSSHHDLLDRLIIGQSPQMVDIKDWIARAASSNSTVSITGESGTGKELVARAIHDLSPRAGHPFIAINCGAIPEALIESELCGHERGAFTGAMNRKEGLFLASNGGTIFLDEFCEMPPMVQVKLLRVLQTRTVKLLGGLREIPTDVRVVVATNKNLQTEVRKGTLREDLYYRVNVLPVHLPPLRERKVDIPLLIDHLLETSVHRQTKFAEVTRIEQAAKMLLCGLSWPGNIRELENVLERLSLGAGAGVTISAAQVIGFIRAINAGGRSIDYFSSHESADLKRPDTRRELDFAKRDVIETALTLTGGNQARAAHLLGMKRAAFHRLRKRVTARTTLPLQAR